MSLLPTLEKGLAKESGLLADRLNEPIGEATSMISVVLTEMVRRALNSGVNQLGAELDQFAAEKVDEAVTQRLPYIEETARDAADGTARTVALAIAQVECARVEEKAHQLTNRLEGFEHVTLERTEGVRRELGGRIEEAERTAQNLTQEVQRDLSARLVETQHTVEARTTDLKDHLTARIEETAKAEQQNTESLATRIEEAAKTVTETTMSEINHQVEVLLERSRQGARRLKARIIAAEANTSKLGERLGQDHEHLRKHVDQQFLTERQSWQSRVESECQRWQARVEELTAANAALEARLAELEKPRGLRALWHWMFGKKAKTQTDPKPQGKTAKASPAARHKS